MDIAVKETLQAILTPSEQGAPRQTFGVVTPNGQVLKPDETNQVAEEVNPYKNKDRYQQVQDWLRDNPRVFPALDALFARHNSVVEAIGESYSDRQDQMRAKFLSEARQMLKQVSTVSIVTTMGTGHRYTPGENGLSPTRDAQFFDQGGSKRWIRHKSGEHGVFKNSEW